MEVITAKNSGFCFGVKRAVDSVYEQLNSGSKIYTYGPIIHNEQVVSELAGRGVKVIDSVEDLKNIREGTKIHGIVESRSREGKYIIVIGSPKHPEVEGIVSYVTGDYSVIENEEEAADFSIDKDREICVVSQTTFNKNKFQELVEIFNKKGYYVSVANTICNATEERQTEAKRIASNVDAMIVIGGAGSSNTQKLFEICRRECKNTQYIQTLDDLVLNFKSIKSVGITAGASTPKKIIQEVQSYVRANF